jgi:transcriptional regulator with XRE-family HTH domain
MPDDLRRSSKSRHSKPPAIDVAFGRVLQEARKEKRLSQEVLGFESGYHRTYVSLLERGLKNPTLQAVFRISTALQVPASDLVRRVEHILRRAD